MEWSVERSRIKLGTIPQNSKVSTLTLSKYGEGNFENYKLIATTMNFVFFFKEKNHQLLRKISVNFISLMIYK